MSFSEELMSDFEAMLKMRTAIGFSVEADRVYLSSFVLFCGNNYPDSSAVTREMVDNWLKEYPFKAAKTQLNAIGIIRHFTSFQNALGKEAFVPDEDYTIHTPRYRPYIFTDAELSTLFTAFDTLPPRYNSPSREYIVPVFFRLMYCCGMRPGEPRRLKCDDVNLDNGDIYIRKTKRNKDRHIVMSEDVRKLCVQYDRMMGERQWFFQRWNGDPLENQWVRSQFSICWNRSGLEKRQNPRPYDLRHCFATRTMMRWIDEGRDIMAMLPYLSAYMGHAKFSYTLYYVHLLPDRLLKSANIDWEQFHEIYKGEKENEED